MIIGVVGGIASGKSTVTRLLAEKGATCIDADEISHQVVEFPAVKKAIRKWLGEEVFTSGGALFR